MVKMAAEKIRILYCMETIASGGVEQRRLFLAQWLDKNRYELKIVCTNSFGFLADELKREGIYIYTVGSFSHPFHIEKYQKVIHIIREFKPHIIHGAVFEGMSMAAIGGFFGKVPIKILEETSDPLTRSKKAVFLQRVYSSISDKVIAISPSVQSYLLEQVRVSKRKATLINNGVRVLRDKVSIDPGQLKEGLGIKQGDVIIGTVGRVYDDIKRFSDLIAAVGLIHSRQVKLLLVGAGPDVDKLKQQVADLGLTDQFIHVGYQQDTSSYYSIMDIFCIASAHEGFGLVAAEAMLHRLPVVASKVGGLKDIVLDNQTGFLVPPYSPNQIAEKLKTLIEYPELQKSMGGKGYDRAIANYTADRYCQEVENLYIQLLSEKGIIPEKLCKF